MLKDLNIPRMGSVENARLIAWRVPEGAAYASGDVLYEVETDKTTTEIEAVEPGILARRIANEGQDFKVGERVGLWAAAGTTPSAIARALAALTGGAHQATGEGGNEGEGGGAQPGQQLPVFVRPDSRTAVRPVPRSAANGVRISPLARRLAALHAVDVGRVTGSGPGGRITGNDVLAAAAATPAASAAPAPVAAAIPALAPAPPSSPTQEDDCRVVPHSSRRLAIARRMSEAAAIPSLTADMEIDMTALLASRRNQPGASVLGLVAYHASAALMVHPRLNALWRDDAVVQWNTVHLGIAVDAEEGLVVPVIRHAERLSARGMTDAIAQLAERARTGKLRAEELEGGTFTISNPGSLGPVIRAEALLNPPQVALLGLPGMLRVPMAVPDGDGWAVAIRPVLRASLTFDHRALDGGPVIAFLNDLKARIEAA